MAYHGDPRNNQMDPRNTLLNAAVADNADRHHALHGASWPYAVGYDGPRVMPFHIGAGGEPDPVLRKRGPLATMWAWLKGEP